MLDPDPDPDEMNADPQPWEKLSWIDCPYILLPDILSMGRIYAAGGWTFIRQIINNIAVR